MDLASFEPIDALTELGQRRLRATKRPRRVAARRLRHREHVRTVNLLRGCTCASHCLEACLPLALPELDHAKESEKRAFDGVTRALDHREGLVHFLIGIPEITAVAVNQGSRSEGIRKADSDAAAADAHGARLVILDAFVEVPERVVVLAGRRVALSEVGHELGECARAARQSSRREANRRYARTDEGRRKSAARSQRYRDRQFVTGHGSLSDGSRDVLDASTTNAVAETSSDRKST